MFENYCTVYMPQTFSRSWLDPWLKSLHPMVCKVGTQSDIRDQRYQNEELRIPHYIGYWNKLLSDIRYPTSTFVNPCSAVVSCQILVMEVVGSKPERQLMGQINLLGSLGNDVPIIDLGISDVDLVWYRNGSWCRYWNYSGIGMKGFFVPISE
jgi:hypothetical protein